MSEKQTNSARDDQVEPIDTGFTDATDQEKAARREEFKDLVNVKLAAAVLKDHHDENHPNRSHD